MSWVGLLLVGLGVTDLVFSMRPSRHWPEAVGAVLVVALGLLAGLTGPADLAALAVLVAVCLGWGHTVTAGFREGRPWPPLVLLGVSLAAAVAFSGAAGPAGGPLGRWLDGVDVGVLGGLPADRFLLLLGCVLVQLSTGNVVVRLVLAVTHTTNPERDRRERTPALEPPRLKGGRLLGPMERLFILGLGLAGQPTAAAVVVAAKGLLRFPELTSKGEQERIHRLTEYFLVGSFASWLVALAALVLLA